MRVLAGVTVCLALGACQSFPERVADKEDLLAASRFEIRLANTPARRASLTTLPANRFVTEASGGARSVVYADPVVCHCLYVGDEQAFDAYRRTVRERELLTERELGEQMYQDERGWDDWPWDDWGGRYPDDLGG